MTQMRFLKKRKNHIKAFNKKQSMTELRKDRRVRRIVVKRTFTKVFTHPIIPKSAVKRHRKIYIAPIGTYVITIKNDTHYKCLKADITREQGYVDELYAIHIMGPFKICWGNQDHIVSKLRYKYDWYWYIIKCLDLLEQGEQELHTEYDDDGGDDSEVRELYASMLSLQLDYLKQVGPKKLLPLVQKKWDYYSNKWNWNEY